MKTIKIFKKDFPISVIALMIFIIISCIYFYPALKGKAVRQPDKIQHIGMSKETVDYLEKYGEETLWTNSMFSGMPTYQISMENPNALAQLELVIFTVVPKSIAYMVMLMVGFYILAICFSINWKIAIIGSIAFGLASFNILYLMAGHNAKLRALIYIPMILGAIVYSYRRKYTYGSTMLAVFLSLHLAAGHLQMTYYLLYIVLAFVIYEFIRHLKLRKIKQFIIASLFLIVATGFAVMSNAVVLFTTKQYSEHTTRGRSELTMHPDTLHKIIDFKRDSAMKARYEINNIIENGD